MTPIDVSYGKNMMLDYFAGEVAGIEEAWEQEAAASQPSSLKKERRRFAEMLGLWPAPARSGLMATVTGEIRRDGILVRKLHYQSVPGLYVTANLYLPEDAEGPLPAVLYLPGHTLRVEGGISYGPKVADHYQTHPIWYARNGIACLIIDTLNGGEIRGAHHGTYNLDRWWWVNRGYTPARIEAWNAIRALDYLESLPEIDASRLAVTGLSGGGGTSWWVNALDERPIAIAPTAGITDLHGYLADHRIENHCDCMFPVNPFRWSLGKVASLGAPRPLLLAQNDRDHLFPIDGVRRLARQAEDIYERFGHRENWNLLVRSGGHSDPPLRPDTYRWIYRHLKGEELSPEAAAPARPMFSMQELRVFEGPPPADERNTRIDEEWTTVAPTPAPPASKADWQTVRDTWMHALRERIFSAWPAESGAARLRPAETTHLGPLTLQAFDLETQEGIHLRLWSLSGKGSPRATELRILDSAGWREWLALLRAGLPDEEVSAMAGPGAFSVPWPAADDEALKKLIETASSGRAPLLFFAPRGVGPTNWRMPDEPRDSIRRAFLPLGQTLESGQVWDVAQAVAALRHTQEGSPIELVGRDSMAGVALYASLVESVEKLSLYRLPATHRQGPFLLNVRRVFDLPQALALAAERTPVVLYDTPRVSSSWARAALQPVAMTRNITHAAPSDPRLWRAGTGRRKITPAEPMWMTGFGFRERPASETLQDLWVKAVAIQDPQRETGLIVSTDVCGVPTGLVERVCSRLKQRFRLPREAIMINVTHTHCGPGVAGYLEALSGRAQMTAEDFETEARYTRQLEEWMVEAAVEALEHLQPASLSWGRGSADFAVNRRNNPDAEVAQRRLDGTLAGPSDPDVPVLAVTTPDHEMLALVASYACHATVLASYEWNGDWPGFAQEHLEKAFPGATGLFVTGCGGDQNPLPRRALELAEQYGADFSESVQAALRRGLKPVEGNLDLRFDTVDLPFDRLPSEDELKEELTDEHPARRERAKVLLARLRDPDGLSPTYPYPIQVWRLGGGLTWVSLAGEVVVDYALRLKKELGAESTWVTAYAHDIMGYIPSRRVWEEGGYEGDGSHIYYALPSKWAPGVEDIIVEKVHEIMQTPAPLNATAR